MLRLHHIQESDGSLRVTKHLGYDYENNQQDALYRLFIIPSRLYMFRAMFLPIIRST